MKKLIVLAMTLLLCSVNSGALAGGKGHKYGHSNHGKHQGKHYKHHKHKKHYKQHKRYKHGKHYGHHGHYGYYRPYRGHRYYGGYYHPDYAYPSYLGAALIGSALTYSLFHTHNGTYCYDNHGNNNYRQSNGRYSEVVGCHRIEQLPDGSERRIEVPMSQCN